MDSLNTFDPSLPEGYMDVRPEIITGKVCPYCGNSSVLIDSIEVYKTQSFGWMYICYDCDAYVGTHKGTQDALGRLANAELRAAKKRAHFYFDQLWKSGKINDIYGAYVEGGVRKKAYKWLSKIFGLRTEHCHIGYFNETRCKTVVNLVLKHYPDCIKDEQYYLEHPEAFEQIFKKHFQKKMINKDFQSFKKNYSTLYSVIIAAMTEVKSQNS